MTVLTTKQMKELEKKGIIESVEYYSDVEFNVFPLLDYLETEQIKQLSKWLINTHKQMSKETQASPPKIGNEYNIAVQAYLANIVDRVATAWTREVFTEEE